MNAITSQTQTHPEIKKRLRMEIVKLSNTIYKNKIQLELDKLDLNEYVQQCNQLFNAFIQRLDQFYPSPFLKEYYNEAFPLEDTQEDFQIKIQVLNEAYQSFEIEEESFKRDVINLIHCFLKVLEGKSTTF